MTLETYSDIVAKIKNDCDLNDEVFIGEEEMLGLLNEAINDAETAIHSLNLEGNYFLTNAYIPLSQGVSNYDLPENIYAAKIRKFYYINGTTTRYKITRIKNLDDILDIQDNDSYRYILVNDEVEEQQQIKLFPPSRETAPQVAWLWYIRNMKRMTTSDAITNVCEVPESINFIYAHMKWNVEMKRARFNPSSGPAVGAAKLERDTQYDLMMANLGVMVPDEDNLVQQDLTYYGDQTLEWYNGI